MKSQVESAKLLVDSFIENPIEVETDKLVAVLVGDGNTVSVIHQRHRHHFVVFAKRHLWKQEEAQQSITSKLSEPIKAI